MSITKPEMKLGEWGVGNFSIISHIKAQQKLFNNFKVNT